MPDTIDPIDLKILEILEKDSRANLNQIADECELSSSAVFSRMNKLKRNGTIVGFGLLVKQGALGYPYEATVGITTETPRTQTIAEEIRKQPNVIVCTKSIGKFNMCCYIIARNVEELDKVTQKIKNTPGVKSVAANIILKNYDKVESKVSEETISANQELDQVDIAIIKELILDSRTPFLKIGKKLKISHETVRNKFEKLRLSGTIVRCAAIIDYSRLGYQGTVFIFISLIQGSDKINAINELKKYHSISRVSSVMGAFDLLAFARFKGLKDFTKLIDDIQQIPSVAHVDICLANFTYFSYTPIPRAPFETDTVELS